MNSIRILRTGLTATAALVALVACRRSVDVEAGFSITRVYPTLAAESEPLLLNDPITVYFSEPVDPLSVSPDSFAVVDAEGRPVRGRLRTEGSYVTFEPEAPLGRDLLDGSLLPSESYRLAVAGYPRADGIRSRRGALLQEGTRRAFRTASIADAKPDRPAPLRPMFSDSRPFVLRPSELGSYPLPVDDPRLALHFTLPILPTSVTTSAFEVTLLRRGASPSEIERIEPTAVRLLPKQPTDEFRGCSVELEFRSIVKTVGSDRLIPLEPEDFMGIRLVAGPSALQDYAGRAAPVQVVWCNVVAGVSVAVAEWPTAEDPQVWSDADLAAPAFEVTSRRTVRPLVRKEAGNGALGILRPTRDLVLRRGQPFDPGDGSVRVENGAHFQFAAIDIPAGVTVQVECRDGPVLLSAVGHASIAGSLVALAADRPMPPVPSLVEPSILAEQASLTVTAASGIEVAGRIAAAAEGRSVAVALVSAGWIRVTGSVPHGSVLATENGRLLASPVPPGCVPVRIRLEPGLPEGAAVTAVGWSPFLALPFDRPATVLRIRNGAVGIRTLWQSAPHDPLRRGTPDLDPMRASAPRDAADGQRIDVPAGSFLRLRLQADLRGGEPLPELLSVRVLDR